MRCLPRTMRRATRSCFAAWHCFSPKNANGPGRRGCTNGRLPSSRAEARKSNDAASDKPLLALRLARVEVARKNRDGALKKLDEYFAAKTTAAGTEPYAILSKLLTDGARDAKAAQAAVIKRLQELRQSDAN